MRQIGHRSLWVGHAGDLRDPSALLSTGVEAVIELADNEPLATLPRELIRCRFPISDSGDSPPWLLRLAVESVAALLKADVPTLVCCSNGLNRSVCVAAGAVAQATGLPFESALIEAAQSGPADVSPRLVAELRAALQMSKM